MSVCSTANAYSSSCCCTAILGSLLTFLFSVYEDRNKEKQEHVEQDNKAQQPKVTELLVRGLLKQLVKKTNLANLELQYFVPPLVQATEFKIKAFSVFRALLCLGLLPLLGMALAQALTQALFFTYLHFGLFSLAWHNLAPIQACVGLWLSKARASPLFKGGPYGPLLLSTASPYRRNLMEIKEVGLVCFALFLLSPFLWGGYLYAESAKLKKVV